MGPGTTEKLRHGCLENVRAGISDLFLNKNHHTPGVFGHAAVTSQTKNLEVCSNFHRKSERKSPLKCFPKNARQDDILKQIRMRITWKRISQSIPPGVRAYGLGFRVPGFGFRVSGFGFRVSGSGFGVSGSEFRVSG